MQAPTDSNQGCGYWEHVLFHDELIVNPTPAPMPTLFPKFPCGSHPTREAIYSNECNALTSHKWAIWYYCEECGQHFLTERGRNHYKI